MKLEAIGRIINHRFSQLPALVVTLLEAKKGPPPLTVAEIDATVDRVHTTPIKAPGLDGIPNIVRTG